MDGRMFGGLLAQLKLRAGLATKGQTEEAPGLQVGRMALTGDPVIRFHDDTVDPQVKIDTVFKRFQLSNLSTKALPRQTDIDIEALITDDGKRLYPISDGIPVLLESESIHVEPLV